MGTGSFLGVESGRGVTLTPHPLLVLRYKNRVKLHVLLLSLRAFMACIKSETYLPTYLPTILTITASVFNYTDYQLTLYLYYWIQHVNRMPRNRLSRVMKHYSPTGRRNHGRPLKRLLDT
jgi:hypothetical protein